MEYNEQFKKMDFKMPKFDALSIPEFTMWYDLSILGKDFDKILWVPSVLPSSTITIS